MRNGMQNLAYSLGQSGCYALCLIDIAEEYNGKEIDIIKAICEAISRGYIEYHWDNWADPNNFFVHQPALFLEMMTKKKWIVKHDLSGREKKEAREYIIRRYEFVQTGRTQGHFERDVFKPYLNSKTVRCGEEVSTRVCIVQN
jgi:hypothetical protein